MAKNSKLWLSLSSGFNDKSQLHILEMLAEGSWQEDIIIKSGDKIDAITSMCQVEGYIWIGDNAGFIHAFDYNSFNLIFSYKMEPDLLEEPSPVRSIHYLQNIKRVSFFLQLDFERYLQTRPIYCEDNFRLLLAHCYFIIF